MLTCVYRPPGSCSDSFLDQFLNLLEYLSSVSPSFLICGDFNIHVDTNDSIKLQNCLESCNIPQNVQMATHLHGHILDLVLTPDASGFSMYELLNLFLIMLLSLLSLIKLILLHIRKKWSPIGGIIKLTWTVCLRI